MSEKKEAVAMRAAAKEAATERVADKKPEALADEKRGRTGKETV